MISVGVLDCIIIYLIKDNKIQSVIGQEIVNILLQSLNDNYLLVAAESINAIIDMFNDDGPNKLWNDNKLLNKLKSFLPVYAKKIKNCKDLDEISMERVELMYENLSGFIDYKKKH